MLKDIKDIEATANFFFYTYLTLTFATANVRENFKHCEHFVVRAFHDTASFRRVALGTIGYREIISIPDNAEETREVLSCRGERNFGERNCRRASALSN